MEPITKPETLEQLCEAYLRHLDKAGRSNGTLFSYRLELRLACTVLGAETPIASLTLEVVQGYYESDRVTKRLDGKPKSRTGVAKTRRVLRLAIFWAAEQKLMPT